MAATNPFRSSDLISKYGWKAIVYLSALGIENLAEAQILFVDSAHTDALDADDTEHGHSFEKPLATWDYAVGLCTAGERSIILLAPTHNEVLADAQVDVDVAGVATIGIGAGGLRPTVDFDHANSSVNVSANNCSIQNVNILPSTPGVLIGLHVETGVTGTRLKNVKFFIGEDGAGADEFIKAVELTSGNHDTVFEDVTILAHASAGSATHGIHVAAASNRLTFKNVIIDGPYATGGIVEAAAGVNHIVEDCAVDVSGTNYSFHGSSTFAKRTNNVDGQVTEDESESLLLTTRGTGNYPTGITDNSILAYLLGKGATASASTYNNTTDSLEAIADAIAAIDNTTNLNTAVPDTPTAKSLQDILSKADGANTYDNTTDSLEAISEALAAGTGCTVAIDADSLDKLVGTSDTDQAYPASLVSHSILSSIMSSDGNPAGYDRATDSLEAIADAVAAITFTAAVSATPTARSLQDILEKDGTSSFSAATDSLEAIADRLIDANVDKLTGAADGTGNYPASVVQDSVVAMILSKSANPVATSYDNQTDSLEAISDALSGAIGSPTAGSALDILKKLYYTADGAGAYPATLANDSTLAKIMCTGATATPSTFDNTTDSLEAISDLLRTGTTVLAGLQLDHLCGTTTGVAADADLETYAVAGSLIAHLASVGADITTFKPSTDSLEAIGTDTDAIIVDIATAQTELDKIGTVVNAGGTATIGGVFGDFANSSLVTRLGNIQTEVDKVGTVVNAGGTATIGAILGDFANSDLVTRLGVITTDTAAIDPGATRVATATTTNWALSAANAMFTVSGLVKAKIWGEVLVAVKAVAMNLKVIATPTAPGGAIDVTANLDCNNDAAGTVYKLATTLGGAMVEVTGGVTADDGIEVILPPGVVLLGSGANEDGGGSIQWFCEYEPLEAGATVTAT